MLTNKSTAKVHPNLSSTKEDQPILHNGEESLYINISNDYQKERKSNDLQKVNVIDDSNVEVKDEAQIKNKLLNEIIVQKEDLDKEEMKSNSVDNKKIRSENLREEEIKDKKIKNIDKQVNEVNAEDQGYNIEKVKIGRKLTKIETKENELKELYATDIALILDRNSKNVLFHNIDEIKEFGMLLKQIKDAREGNHKREKILQDKPSKVFENLEKQALNQKQDDEDDIKEEIKKEVNNIMEQTKYQINRYVLSKIFCTDDPRLKEESSQYNCHTVPKIARLLSEYLLLNELIVLRKKIFEREHPSMPSCIRMGCLWIRLKTNSAQQYYFKRIIKKWVPNSINLILCGIEIYNIVTDIILLWTIYQFSLRYQNQYTDYIVLYTTKLVCICIPYIIAYANGNQILIAKKTFYPEIFTKKPWYLKLLIGLYLTFLGPLYFIFLKILVSIMALLKCLILFFPINTYQLFDQKIDSLILKIGLERSEYDGILQQMAICQLIFQNLPLAILDILLVTGVFITPGILNESSILVYIALASTFTNITIQFIQLKIQANYFEEGFFNYTFNIMKAKLKWIPFLQKIKKNEMIDMVLDYGYIRCPFWIFSSWFGYYMESQYQFNEVSMITFSEVIYNLQEKRKLNSKDFKIPEIMISNSVNGISLPCLGMLLRGLIIIDIEKEKLMIPDFNNINWDSKVELFIMKDGEHGKKVDLRTYYGDSILHMLVQCETHFALRVNSRGFWLSMLMDSITKNNSFINLDLQDDNNATPLQLALLGDKRYCAYMLLKAGCYKFMTSEGENIFHILLNLSLEKWEYYAFCFEHIRNHEELKYVKNKQGQTPLVSVLEKYYLSHLSLLKDQNRLGILGINIPLNDVSTANILIKNLQKAKEKHISVMEYIIEYIRKQENTQITKEELINHLSKVINNHEKNENQLKIQDSNIKSPNISDNREIIIEDDHISSETHHNILYSLLSFLLESLAMADLITDVFVVIQLASNGHTSWTSISILTFLAPYYTCYSPLIACFIERDTFSKARGILGWILITPFSILYFILIDLIYIVAEFLSLILTIITFGLINKFINMENKFDLLFEHALRLDNMDVRGIRQLRTITQLIFESIPQLILQARILGYGGQLNININGIIISLIAALFHIILEASIIIIESRACKTTFGYYSSLCLASRLNWVPFIERFSEYYRNPNRKKPIDYGNMRYKVCWFSHVIKYEFNKSTLQILKQEIEKLPRKKQKEDWLDISLCPIKNIELSQIWDFLMISDKRAIVKKLNYTQDFEDVNLISKANHLKIDCSKWRDNINDYIMDNIIEMISLRKNTLKKVELNVKLEMLFIYFMNNLILDSCDKITTRGLICLSKSISQLTYLEEFNLNMYRIELPLEVEIAEFTMNLSCLKSLSKLSLNLENCKITDQHMLHISNMLEKFQKISFLCLNFKNKEITHEGIKHLAEGIKNLETIQILELSFIWFQLNDIKVLINIMMILMHREKNTHEEGMNVLASNINNLTSIQELNISVSCYNSTTKEGLNILADAIGKLNTITALNFDNALTRNLNDEIFKNFGNKIQLLKRLSKLRLYFNSTSITDEGLGYFGEIIKNIHSINSLDFSFESYKNISDEGIKKFSMGIQEMSNIQSLKIRFRLSNQEDQKEILSLGNLLVNKPKLSELFLELSTEKIKGSEIVVFSNKIKEFLELKTLTFKFDSSKSPITPEGLKSLAEVIKSLKTLKTLHLAFLGLEESKREDLKPLYEVLTYHESLVLITFEIPEEIRIYTWEKLIEDNLRKKKGNFYKK